MELIKYYKFDKKVKHMSQNYQRFKRIVIVSYRLPYKIVNKGSERSLEQNTGGLVSAILSLADKMSSERGDTEHQKIIWIGHSEFSKEELDKMSSSEIDFDVHPVSIPEKIRSQYYEGFCNDLLWPLFHYFPMYTVFKDTYFEAYKKSNQLFMDVIDNVVQPDDLIWVHDYQLFLLPKLIRNKFPKSIIGFFLHIPFPSFEIFRLLNRKWREELLNGILGADLIGFHTNDYTQHFLYTVKRVLGLENSLRKVYTPERVIKADSFPIGIDYGKFSGAVTTESVLEQINNLNDIIGDKKLIFSVDRLDYTKGLLNRLLGYEQFLDRNPDWQGKVIFNMVVAPSRDKIPRYKSMKRDIEATVGRINGKYSYLGWRPIVYQYKSISFNELVALCSISHCGLITPLRDGMNLVAKEFVACQGKNIGVLILSEMAGAVAELGEAIIINPTDTTELADAILKALEMPLQERKEKIMRMKKRIQNYNIFSWTEDFINQIQLIKKEQDMLDIKLLNNSSINNIVAHYRKANNRLILLDYDGTLIPFSKYPEDAIPDDKVRGQILKLSEDKKNKVVIISGRDKKFSFNLFA